MLKNWILIAIRRFLRNKVNFFINLSGLSLGIIVYLLIFVYIKHEFSYDNFHEHREQIFRLIKENPAGENNYNGRSKQAVLPAPLAEVIKTQITGVESVSRMASLGNLVVEHDGQTFYEDSYNAADGDLFKILTFSPLRGNVDHALETPNTIALSEATAIKYFGTVDVIGKVVELTGYERMGRYTVDLVFKDFATNSSYQFKVIVRFVDFIKAVRSTDLENWNNYNYNFLARTYENVNPIDVEGQIKQFFVKKYAGTADEEEIEKSNYLLEPLSDIYLRSDVNFSNTPRNDINKLYMLATIALFVLIVAGINYVNLTTARSINRAKEVGIRKVSGAFQSNLITQFLGDAMIISIISMIVALMVTWMILPFYREFIGKPLPFDLIGDPWLLFSVIVIPLLLGFLAGVYPAFVLSSFKPVQVLKSNFGQGHDGDFTRDILTVFQFVISSCLIIAVLIIGQQLEFIETHDPGYNREHILKLSLADEGVRAKREVLAETLRKEPNILAVSIASYFPNQVNTQQGREWKGAHGKTSVSFYTTHADYDYIDLFEIKIVKGRNFSPTAVDDRNAFLINEEAARVYGWDDPVGMQFTGENEGRPGDTVHIIGVIKDMHISNYRRPIEPFRIGFLNNWSALLAIKIKPDDIPGTLKLIEENYKKLATSKLPYRISFFDEDFNATYKTDRQLGRLINMFSIVAVLIACLGLYGLSIYTVAQRKKEIGIRKILGAGLDQIIHMLSRKFIILVLIAFFIAAPIAYYIMDQWLQTFAYHVNIGVTAFLLPVVSLIVIALITVGSQTWRAATSSPVEVLRSE